LILQQVALEHGLILVDTKYEFGNIDILVPIDIDIGNIDNMDETHCSPRREFDSIVAIVFVIFTYFLVSFTGW